MIQADYIMTSKTTHEEIWYSQEYLLKQIELAYRAGLAIGANIEIYTVQPMCKKGVDDLTNVFWDKVNEQYTKEFENGHVWRIAGQSKIK